MNEEDTGAQTEETEQAPESEVIESGDDATAKPKKSGIQERINELTRQRHDKERDLEAARQEAEYWKSQVVQKPAQPQTAAPTGKPTVEQYDSYEDYLEALSDYKVEQKLSVREQEQSRSQQQEQLVERQKAFQARAEKLEIDDFVEVVYNPDIRISQDMADIAFDSEKGPEILYYLGKNPAEAARLASLDTRQVGYEIGRLEAALSLPQAKTQSSAPPPIKPISGGGEPPQMDQEKMTPDQWRDWRNEQLRLKGAR
jgi:hypothetical protein